MAGDTPPRGGHHPGTALFGHRGSSSRSLLRTLTSLAKKRTKLSPSPPSTPDRAEFVPGTAAVSSLTPDTYEARGLHETQATQLPSTTTAADAPDPEAPLVVHVSIRFPGRRPCPLPTYAHTYTSSRCLDPTDRLCEALVQRLEHCSTEFITRKDSAALDHQKPPPSHQRASKPLRYGIRFRVVRRHGGVWAEKSFRSYQAHELTSQDARDLILATHRMVGLFLCRHDPSFSWTDLPAASEMQFAVAFGLPSPPSLPERIRPVVGEPLPLVCVPKQSLTDPEAPRAAPAPGYSISFTFRSRCPSRSRRDWKRLVYLQSTQGTPLTLALAEDLFGQTSAAITSALATRQAVLLQEHRACDALDGVATTCQHFAEDAVEVDLRIENSLGPDYDHLHRSIRSKLMLFRHPDGLDCRQFLHDVRSRLVQARDAADRGLTSLPDFDLRILTLCGPGWSIDNPARFVLDAGPTIHTRDTVEAILDRVLTGIANVVGGKTYTLQLAAYKRGHLVLDKVLLGRAAPANPWLRPSSAGEQTDALVARLRDRIQEDIAAVCKDTCLLDGISEGTGREAETTQLAAATPDAPVPLSEPAPEPTPATEIVLAGGTVVETIVLSTPAPRVVDLPDDVFFDALESRPSSSATTISMRRRAFPLLPEKFTLPHARSISVGTANTRESTQTFDTAITAASSFSQLDAFVDAPAAPPSVVPTAESTTPTAATPPTPIPDSAPADLASEALSTIEPTLEREETEERSVQEFSGAVESSEPQLDLKQQPEQLPLLELEQLPESKQQPAVEQETELEQDQEPELELQAEQEPAPEPELEPDLALELESEREPEPELGLEPEPEEQELEKEQLPPLEGQQQPEHQPELEQEEELKPEQEEELKPEQEEELKPEQEEELKPEQEEELKPEQEEELKPKPELVLELAPEPELVPGPELEQQTEPEKPEQQLEVQPEVGSEPEKELQSMHVLELLPPLGEQALLETEQKQKSEFLQLTESVLESNPEPETETERQQTPEPELLPDVSSRGVTDVVYAEEAAVLQVDDGLEEQDMTLDVQPDASLVHGTTEELFSADSQGDNMPPAKEAPDSSLVRRLSLSGEGHPLIEPSAPFDHNNDIVASLSPSSDAQEDTFAADTVALTAHSSNTSRPSTPCLSAHSGTYDSPNSSFLDDETPTQRKGGLEGDASSHHSHEHSGESDVDAQDFASFPASAVDLDDNFNESTRGSRAPVYFSLVSDESESEEEEEGECDPPVLGNFATTELEDPFEDFAMSKPAIDLDDDDTATALDAVTATTIPAVALKDEGYQSSGGTLQFTRTAEDQTTFDFFSTSANTDDTDDIDLSFPDYGHSNWNSHSIATAELDEQQPSTGSLPDIGVIPELRLGEALDAVTKEELQPCELAEPPELPKVFEAPAPSDTSELFEPPESSELPKFVSAAEESPVPVEIPETVEATTSAVLVEPQCNCEPEPIAHANALESFEASVEDATVEAVEPDAGLSIPESPAEEDGELSNGIATLVLQEPDAAPVIDNDEHLSGVDAELGPETLDKSLSPELQNEQDPPVLEETAHDEADNFDDPAEPLPARVQFEENPALGSDSAVNTPPESENSQEPLDQTIDMVSVQEAPDLSVPEAVPAVQTPEIQLPPEILEVKLSQPLAAGASAETESIEAAVQDVVSDLGKPVENACWEAAKFAVAAPEPLAPVSEAPLAKDNGKALGWDHATAIGKELVRGSSATIGRLVVPDYRVTPAVSAIRRGPWSLPTAGYLGLPKKNIAAFGLRSALTGSHAFDAPLVQSQKHGQPEGGSSRQVLSPPEDLVSRKKVPSKKIQQPAPRTTAPPHEEAMLKQPSNSTGPASDKSLVLDLPPPSEPAAATASTVATAPNAVSDRAPVSPPAEGPSGALVVEELAASQDTSALPRLIFAFASLAVVAQMVHRPS